MLAPIPGGAMGLDSSCANGKTLRGSNVHDRRWPAVRSFSGGSLYSKTPGCGPLAQAPTDNRVNPHERAVLRELLAHDDLDGAS